MKTSRILTHTIAALLLSVPALYAAPDTLTGSDPVWASGGNWSLGTPPGVGSNAVIGATGIVDVNGTSLAGLTEIQDLTFNNAGGVIMANDSASSALDLALNGGRGAGVPLIQTLGDAAYTIQGPGTNAIPNALRLLLKASGDFSVGSSDPNQPLTISSVIAESGGARSLRKTGAGRLILSGANSFTGGVTIAAGILEVRSKAALATGPVTLSGGTLQVRENGAFVSQTLIYGQNIAVLAGGGSINADRVSGTNTLITIQFGTLSIGAQTLNLSGGNSYKVRFSGATTLTGDATFNVGQSGSSVMPVLMGGAISGGFGITKAGVGTLRLQAANPYSGQTTINGGTLVL